MSADPRQELSILRRMKAARDAGDARSELTALRELKALRDAGGAATPTAQPTAEPAPSTAPIDARAQLDQSLNPDQRTLINLGRGMLDVFEGARQAALEAGDALQIEGADEALLRTNRQAAEDRQVFEAGTVDDGAAAVGARIAGNVAATMLPGGPVAKGLSMIPRARQALATTGGRVLSSGTTGALAGGASFVKEGESRAIQAGLGGLLGVVGGEVIFRTGRRVAALMRRGQVGEAQDAAVRALPEDVPDAVRERVRQEIGEGLSFDQAVRKAEAEVPVPGAQLSRGRLTGDIDQLAAEDAARREAGAFANAEQANRRAIEAQAQEFIARQGATVDDPANRFAVGESVRDTLRTGKERGREEIGLAYRAAEERARDLSSVVQPTRVVAALDEAADVMADESVSSLRSTLIRNGLLRKTEDGIFEAVDPGRVGIEKSEAIRKQLNKMKVTGEAKEAVRRIRNALDADVVDAVGEDVFAEARKIYVRELNTFTNDQKVRAILKGVISPDDVVSRSKNFGTEDLRKIVSTLDGIDPQATRNFRAGMMDQLMSKALGQVDRDGVHEITALTFENELRRFGVSRLDAVFGEGAGRELRTFARALTRLTVTDRGVANPGTAGALRQMTKSVTGMVDKVAAHTPMLAYMRGFHRLIRNTMDETKVKERALSAMDDAVLKRERIEQAAGLDVGAASAVLGGGALPATQSQ